MVYYETDMLKVIQNTTNKKTSWFLKRFSL